jgi:hypothetical protein
LKSRKGGGSKEMECKSRYTEPSRGKWREEDAVAKEVGKTTTLRREQPEWKAEQEFLSIILFSRPPDKFITLLVRRGVTEHSSTPLAS